MELGIISALKSCTGNLLICHGALVSKTLSELAGSSAGPPRLVDTGECQNREFGLVRYSRTLSG